MGPLWKEILKRTEALAAALPSPLGSLFKLTTSLAVARSPAVVYDRLGTPPMSEERYLSVVLAGQVDELMPSLVQHYPSLVDLDYDLSGVSIDEVLRKIGCLHERIGHSLSPGGTTPGPSRSTETVAQELPAVSSKNIVSSTGTGGRAVPPTPGERNRLLELKKKIDPEDKYIGKSDAILRVFQRIEELNKIPSEPPVVLLGPSGAGKTEIAHLIHESSQRRRAKFYREQAAVNKASDSTVLIGRWSGYGKSTGFANQPRTEALLADYAGGTIFVDEFGDFGLEFQGFLRDVLDRKAIAKPAGSGAPVQVNVRLVFATNRNLKELERTGEVRHDLIRRIERFTVSIPELAERKEDIFLFVKSKCPDRIPSPEFLLCLLRHDWPGQVRELVSILESVNAGTKEGERLSLQHLESDLSEAVAWVRQQGHEDTKRAVYTMLADLLKRQGFAKHKGGGLQNEMAKYLGVKPWTVSRVLSEMGTDSLPSP